MPSRLAEDPPLFRSQAAARRRTMIVLAVLVLLGLGHVLILRGLAGRCGEESASTMSPWAGRLLLSARRRVGHRRFRAVRSRGRMAR